MKHVYLLILLLIHVLAVPALPQVPGLGQTLPIQPGLLGFKNLWKGKSGYVCEILGTGRIENLTRFVWLSGGTSTLEPLYFVGKRSADIRSGDVSLNMYDPRTPTGQVAFAIRGDQLKIASQSFERVALGFLERAEIHKRLPRQLFARVLTNSELQLYSYTAFEDSSGIYLVAEPLTDLNGPPDEKSRAYLYRLHERRVEIFDLHWDAPDQAGTSGQWALPSGVALSFDDTQTHEPIFDQRSQKFMGYWKAIQAPLKLKQPGIAKPIQSVPAMGRIQRAELSFEDLLGDSVQHPTLLNTPLDPVFEAEKSAPQSGNPLLGSTSRVMESCSDGLRARQR